MTAAVFSIFYILIIVAVIKIAAKKGKLRVPKLKVSSDGHCDTNDGHHHADQSAEFGRRYIVHNEPNEGYVVLNGVQRKLEDCKNL